MQEPINIFQVLPQIGKQSTKVSRTFAQQAGSARSSKLSVSHQQEDQEEDLDKVMNEMVDFQILTVKDMIKTTNLPVPDLNFPTASQMVKQKKAEKRKQIEDQLEKQKQALQIRGKVVSDYDFNQQNASSSQFQVIEKVPITEKPKQNQKSQSKAQVSKNPFEVSESVDSLSLFEKDSTVQLTNYSSIEIQRNPKQLMEHIIQYNSVLLKMKDKYEIVQSKTKCFNPEILKIHNSQKAMFDLLKKNKK